MEDAGLLLIRVVVGLLFVGHGTGKLFGWFAGHGPEGTGQYFESLGYPRGRTMAILAGLTEVVAGLAFGAGFLTPLAAAAIIGVMINASVSAHRDAGLWSENEGYEYPLVLSAVAAAVTVTGPGAASLDDAIGWGVDGIGWGVGAAALGVLIGGTVLATRHSSGVVAPTVR